MNQFVSFILGTQVLLDYVYLAQAVLRVREQIKN